MNKSQRVALFNSLTQEIDALDIAQAQLIEPKKLIEAGEKKSKNNSVRQRIGTDIKNSSASGSDGVKSTSLSSEGAGVQLTQKSTVDVLLSLCVSTEEFGNLNEEPGGLGRADTQCSKDTGDISEGTSDKVGRVGALVFMSAKNPGGGVLRGSQAQEEDISLVSTWYHQVKGVQGFYSTEKSCMNSDSMLYVENAFLLRDKLGVEIEKKAVSLIGAAAVNLSGLVSSGEKFELERAYEVMRQRVRNVLYLAKDRGIDTLVLGAWGGGVFGLDNKRMAQIFAQEIKRDTGGQKFIFAILGQAYFDYKEVFEQCGVIHVHNNGTDYKKESLVKLRYSFIGK